MFLLFDGHRELLRELIGTEPALLQHPRQLSRKRALVLLAREKRDRLAALTSTTCATRGQHHEIGQRQKVSVSTAHADVRPRQTPVGRGGGRMKAVMTHLSARYGGCNPQS